MFSSRAHWNTAPNQLSDLATEKRLHGESIIDLTESNPTRCEFSYPKQEILTALADESNLVYQPQPRGLLSAREAVTKYYTSHGISITPEQIVLTASTSEAYSFLFKLLCNVNDEVIVPQPSYPLFEYLCQLNDVELRRYRLAYDGEWHVDFTSLQNEVTRKTRAIVLIHPNNPTGSYIKQDEFDRFCTFANKHNCAIIVDEVFEQYAFSHDKRRANILASQSPVLLFSLNGISKLLGLPQFKLSWIIVHGDNQKTIEALNKLDIIADTYLSVNTPVQAALPKLFQYSSHIGEQILERVHANYKQAQAIFSGTSTSVFEVEGGWYAILQLPQIHSDDEWAVEILSRCNIQVYPGHFFDLHHKSCIVISLLPISNIFYNTIMQLRRFIEER
jgi:aspartate/methionine/tyrosine aminotransferase